MYELERWPETRVEIIFYVRKRQTYLQVKELAVSPVDDLGSQVWPCYIDDIDLGKHKSTWVLKKGECPKAEQSEQVNSASLCPLPFTVGNTALGAGLAWIKATALLQLSAEVSGELMVVFHFTTSRAIPALRLQPIVSCPSPTPWIQNLLLCGDAGSSQCSGSTKTFKGNSKGLRDCSSITQVLSCTQTLQQPNPADTCQLSTSGTFQIDSEVT